MGRNLQLVQEANAGHTKVSAAKTQLEDKEEIETQLAAAMTC